MTRYLNASTRHDGAKQIVVPDRMHHGGVEEPPFDDVLYARQNGMWVPVPPPYEPPVPVPLPGFVRGLLLNGSTNVTSSTWVDVGTTIAFTTDEPVLCSVSFQGLPQSGLTTALRVRLAWSGATNGNSYAAFGNSWAGCLTGTNNATRDFGSLTLPVRILDGTTTFKVQAMRESGTATCNIADVGMSITPIGWAADYDL